MIKPPKIDLSAAGLPNETDPRGLLTFGATALALFIVAWLILRGAEFPRGLAYLAFVSAVLLVVIYLGRLIVLNPKSPVLLVAALLFGFVVNPAWYVWLGLVLLSAKRFPGDNVGST